MTTESLEQASIGTTGARQLEMTRRLLGSSAIVSVNPSGGDVGVALDVAGFVRRLLLFDTYVLYSVRLKEIPELVRHFGYEGTMELLSSGALEIRCECAQFAEGALFTPPAPLLTFQFHVMEAHVWEQYLIDSLPVLAGIPGLGGRERLDLQSAVVKAVTRGDNRQMFANHVSPAFESEVLHNERLVKAAVMHILSKNHGIANAVDFKIRFHKEGDDARYRTETNLQKRVNISTEEVHNAVKSALLGIAGICQRLGEMSVHSALSGFTEEEAPLFRVKLGSIAEGLVSQGQEGRFTRVISISGVPELSSLDRIDIGQILKIREEREAVEFRGWLADVNKLSDSEIRDRVAGFNARIGRAIQSVPGKTMRLIATVALGVWNPAVGVAASALDAFVWDRFFKQDGVAAFINELYPSIFETRSLGDSGS
jgi:hypothetical protein